MKTSIPPIPENWINQQFGQYPDGAPGVDYFRGDIDGGLWVDCLLYRDGDGKVRGVLNHFPVDIPPEKKGNFLVLVARDYRGRGIGSALLKEACKRWDISLGRQNYTKQGVQFVKGYLSKTRQ